MSTFTIDSENNIAAHAEVPAGAENLQSFATEKELAKLAPSGPALAWSRSGIASPASRLSRT